MKDEYIHDGRKARLIIKATNTNKIKATVVWCLLLLFCSPIVLAVKLSSIKVRSLLNEPFDAKIIVSEVEGIVEDGMLVSIAERGSYEALGLEPLSWLYRIKFKVTKDSEKDRFVIKLSTLEPVKDPYIDLIIVINWEQGKIVREYTVLLDPPREVVPYAAVPPARLEVEKEVLKSSEEATEPTPETTMPPEAKQAKSPPVKRTQVAQRVKARANQRRRERAQARIVRPGGHYAVTNEETLWNVAKKLVKDTPYSVNQGVMAITARNPEAFPDGNMNSFTAAAVQMPSEHDLSSVSEEDAQYFIDAQNEVWEQQYVKASIASLQAVENIKPLRLVAQEGEEGIREEIVDALKRTNETVHHTNEALKNQNALLSEQLAQKEQEIQLLKEKMRAQIEEEAPPSAGMPSMSRTHSIKKTIVLIVIFVVVLFCIGLIFWFIRDIITDAISKVQRTIRRFFNVHPSMSNVSSMMHLADMKDYVSFDLEKALAVLSQEEKRHVTTGKIKNVEEGEITVEAIDTYIAYERYGYAEKMVKDLLVVEPKNWEVVYRLLEIYILTENYQAFEATYATLPQDLNVQLPALYEKIATLNKKVQNEKALKQLVLTPEEVKTQIALAQSYLKEGNKQAAHECLVKANTTTDAQLMEEIQKMLLSIESQM